MQDAVLNEKKYEVKSQAHQVLEKVHTKVNSKAAYKNCLAEFFVLFILHILQQRRSLPATVLPCLLQV